MLRIVGAESEGTEGHVAGGEAVTPVHVRRREGDDSVEGERFYLAVEHEADGVDPGELKTIDLRLVEYDDPVIIGSL